MKTGQAISGPALVGVVCGLRLHILARDRCGTGGWPTASLALIASQPWRRLDWLGVRKRPRRSDQTAQTGLLVQGRSERRRHTE